MALALIFNIYIFRGGASQQGFSAAAKTAHEGKMAGIISFWRGFGGSAMVAMVSVGAFTLLHHPDFAAKRELVTAALTNIGSSQLQTQMTMPMALSMLLAPGIKGAFCAIALFGLLSSQGMALHGFGSTFLQDVVLPLKKKTMAPRTHLIALQLAAVGVGLFVCVFSFFYKPADYLTLVLTLIGAIYLGGVGAVVWGGLYWKKGTTAGAWAAMITGTSLALLFNVIQPFWENVQPLFLQAAQWAGNGSVTHYLTAHPDKCPLNGQQFSTGTAICAFLVYVLVSLLTCKEDFDMDRMLHRGKYAISSEDDIREPLRKGFRWGALIGIDEHYTKGDRVIACTTFFYSMMWKCCSISIILWWVFVGRLSDSWWFKFTMISGIWIPIVVAVITTIWLTIGTVYDLIDLFKTLRSIRRNDADDGTVRDHHNLGDASSDPIAKP